MVVPFESNEVTSELGTRRSFIVKVRVEGTVVLRKEPFSVYNRRVRDLFYTFQKTSRRNRGGKGNGPPPPFCGGGEVRGLRGPLRSRRRNDRLE